VSYFIGASPMMGLADYTYTFAGVPWYYASAANRDVFMRHPDVYAPQFGGHCTTALARGYLSDGNPQLYAVEGMKLYLFYSIANRDAFFAADTASVKTASATWARMQKSIAGPQAPIAPTVASAD
jgi:YHS domain-containing protein